MIVADDLDPAGHSDDEMIVLKGGVVVPLSTLRLGWRLENRGITFRVERGMLIANPRERLTAADCADIRRHLPDLKRLASYMPDGL